MKITKAIIPIAGLGTRFLPLSKVVPKEFFPLVDKPVLQYIIEEAVASGIKEIIFVNRPEKREVLDYFKKYFERNPELEKFLKNKNKNHILKEIKKIENIAKKVSFRQVFQKEPWGDGHATLQAAKIIGQEPCAVLWADDIVDSKIPSLLQLAKIFKTCQKPIIALYRLPKERLPSYGVVGVEKIANRLYKIKKIIEKPSQDLAPSDLAIVGKYILTPEVFDYLKKARPGEKGEIFLSETLDKMIKDGKIIYGYEFKGKWLECGNKQAWLESNLYLSLKHPEFGPKLRQYLKKFK